MLTRELEEEEEDNDDGEELPGDEEKHELFCSLKANSLKTGTNIKMTVFAFWFDSNKEQHYPFLGTRVIRGLHFLMMFTTQFLYRNYYRSS